MGYRTEGLKSHYVIGLLIALMLAVLFFVAYQAEWGNKDPKLWGALVGGTVAAAATSLGALPVVLALRFSERVYDSLLGFGAGVMLAASSFSLILPALSAAKALGSDPWGAGALVGAGILIGAFALLLINKVVPHEHFVKGREGAQSKKLKRVWLFVLAISLHNLPEGLAIGVAFAGPDEVGANALALGIAIQDIPEGMVVALALRGVGYSRGLAVAVAVLSGLIEPLASVLGVAVIGISSHFLPWGLAGAAGAMLYVISHEIIPESHQQGHEAYATVGLMIGFVLMMVLDTALS